MPELPLEYRYTAEHEWLLLEGDIGTVGITDYAQENLGDVTYVELPPPGTVFHQGETLGVIESVKAASDLFMPVGGEILQGNADAEERPEMVNEEPYKTWLVKLRITDPTEVDDLLTADAYGRLIGR